MDFRYPPSHFTPDYVEFGDNRFDPWSGPDDPNAEARAARVQDQVARFVRRHLKLHGITQKEFAATIGIDRPKVSRLLTGAMWASLTDLELMLGECGATLTSVALAVGDGSHQSPRVKKIIASYLQEALAKVEGEIARTEPEHPSTSDLPQPADPASVSR
ncbi:helix-turn-helix domain-containing protein [Microbacterium sp. NPDC087589]|uniref:helix-turn-helix domain-containing protein n=1 Tax=Microbacterium sp. NPDC087589 TaxID=3364191 RepID=UPI0038243224